MGIREQRDLLDRHEISVKELTECYLNRIETYDPALQSYITVTKEQAYQDAETAQKKLMTELLLRSAEFRSRLRITFVRMAFVQRVHQKCWRISFRRTMQPLWKS